jgi:hypothetical protein
LEKDLNRQLPAGLSVLSCRKEGKKRKSQIDLKTTYDIEIKDGVFDEKRLSLFSQKAEWVVLRKNRKKRDSSIDLKQMVLSLELVDPRSLRMVIVTRGGKTLRPAEVMIHLFNMSEMQCKTARIVKKKAEAVSNGMLSQNL